MWALAECAALAAFRDTGFDWNCQRGPVEGCRGQI